MKKILLILSFLIIANIAEARDCTSGDIKGDAFIYSDGKKVKVIQGTDIPNPANKIIMIFNKGGWKIKWPEGKTKLTSENKFITLDKKQKKEMKKKPMGHYLISYSCFNYYHPEIVKYIDSRL